MTETNRRKNSRVAFQATVSLSFAGARYEQCETRDLSLKGVFVVGLHGHKTGEQCEVVLCLTGTTSRLCLEMKGEVARVEADGSGLRFREIDLDSFYHLKNILYYNSENPDQLDEEFNTQIHAIHID
ncbi:MAG: PilZ domain-containing protein [Thermodesulfobacteriota bacterium]